METKRDKFVRLAEARTNKIIKMIELLGNLSNTSTYEFTEEDINSIYERILTELKLSKDMFELKLRKRNKLFVLENSSKEIATEKPKEIECERHRQDDCMVDKLRMER